MKTKSPTTTATPKKNGVSSKKTATTTPVKSTAPAVSTPRANAVKKSPAAAQSTATEDQIALRAYQIWEQQGCPEGSDELHWHQAEQELTPKNPLTFVP